MVFVAPKPVPVMVKREVGSPLIELRELMCAGPKVECGALVLTQPRNIVMETIVVVRSFFMSPLSIKGHKDYMVIAEFFQW
jgi:hypothetical protein